MSKNECLLVIGTDGRVTSIYNDDLADLYAVGKVTITRASHVEPTSDGEWQADMAPVGGPVLGPFKLRQDALDAEVAWLEKKLFE